MSELEQLLRAGWSISLIYHPDHSLDAPEPTVHVFTLHARRLDGERVRVVSGHHQSLAVAVAIANEKAKRK